MAEILPDSVGLAIPDSWRPVPLDQDAFADYLKTQIVDAGIEADVPRTALRQAEVMLTRLRHTALKTRTFMMASLAALDDVSTDQSDDHDKDDQNTLVTASCVVSGILRSDLDTNIPLMTETILAASSQSRSNEFTGVDGVEYDEIEPPKDVTLGSLPAVKFLRVLRSTTKSEPVQRWFGQSYVVPIANGDAAIAIHFVTPNAALAKPLSELFDRIAATLRVFYPDDETLEVASSTTATG